MKLPLIVLGTLSLTLLPGCLVSSSSNTTISGHDVSPKMMAQIEPGKTRKDFVLATLGEPTTKTPLEDGSEVWKYEYRKKSHSSGAVFLLLNHDNYTEKDGAVYIILRDGLVEKTWRDN
jgi:outer membrane protein assembly factor BamE (lipoprotein component of BamABCDE complex)